MPRVPDPIEGYEDAEVVWSSAFPDAVGVKPTGWLLAPEALPEGEH